jgi:hypothetical protein
MADPYLGDRAKLEVNSGGWLTIGRVTDINGPSLSAEVVETTALDTYGVDGAAASATNAISKTFIQGHVDAGELTFTIQFDPEDATHDAIRSGTLGGGIKAWKLTYPDDGAAIWAFSGITTGMSPSLPLGDVMTCDITVKITGQHSTAATIAVT